VTLGTAVKTVPLHEVATIERAVVDPAHIRKGTLYVGLEHMDSDGQVVHVQTVDEGELASSKFAFSSAHILYGKLRPYLAKIARPNFSGVCSTDILPILPGKNLSRDFEIGHVPPPTCHGRFVQRPAHPRVPCAVVRAFVPTGVARLPHRAFQSTLLLSSASLAST
jgi:hypothetical protein